jgi:hypothetical protein
MRLSDQFKHIRHSSLQISLKALNYRLFKSDFKLEDYLDVVNEKKNIFTFCRFRTSNHRLPIEEWALNSSQCPIFATKRTKCNSILFSIAQSYCNFRHCIIKRNLKFFVYYANLLM